MRGGHRAALTRIVSKEIHIADSKRSEFLWRCVQLILAEWLSSSQLQVRTKSAPNAFDLQLREPFLHRAKTGIAHDRRTEGDAIVGESSAGVVPQHDRKTEVLTQPAIDSRRRVQVKLDGGFTLQKPNLLKPTTTLARQRVDNRRCFSIYYA